MLIISNQRNTKRERRERMRSGMSEKEDEKSVKNELKINKIESQSLF